MSKKRIGNTTNSPRNSEKIVKYSKLYSEEIAEYKRLAESHRRKRVYTQEKVAEYYEKLGEYVADCQASKSPVTVAGIWLALGVNKDYWSKAINGEYDYLLEEYLAIHEVTEDSIEYINGLPYHQGNLLIPHSDLVEKGRMIVQDQLERNCYSNKGNPMGSIAGMNNYFGWGEDKPQHVVQNLVIADKDQAEKAMRMLTNVEK